MPTDPTRSTDPLAGDESLWVYSLWLRAGRLPVIRLVVRVIHYLFVDLAPGVPAPVTYGLTPRAKRDLFLGAYGVTVLFCLGVTGVWSAATGTLYGSDPDTLYFLSDVHNLVLYAVVCPLYVGVGAVLVATVIGGWYEIKTLESDLTGAPVEFDRLPSRAVALTVLVMGVAFLTIANYIHDLEDAEAVAQTYWFMEEVGPGVRKLTGLGVYYFLLNFILLLATLVSLAMFMSAFAATLGVARALERIVEAGEQEVDFRVVGVKLSTFVSAYLLAKVQVGVYILNFYIWANSPLGAATRENVYAAHLFLVLVGVFFLSIPRSHLELQWHRYRAHRADGAAAAGSFRDLIDYRARNLVKVIDAVLIASLLTVPWLSYSF